MNDLRAWAVANGVDLDALLDGASRHFTSPFIATTRVPLTDAEIDALVEDDLMAIIENCAKCGTPFTTRASSFKFLCENCDGSKEREQTERDRWNSLTQDQKLDEIKAELRQIWKRLNWDGRIG